MSEVNPYQPPLEARLVESPGSLPVRVGGVLTADDAITTLRKVGKWRPWQGAVITIPLAIIIAIGFAVNDQMRNVWVPIVTVGIAMVIALWLVLGAKGRMQKQWNSRPEHANPMMWTFSEDGLFVETTNSKHLHAWSAFTQASVSPEMLILTQQGNAMWNFIPRRFFSSDADWYAVTQLLAAKLRINQVGPKGG